MNKVTRSHSQETPVAFGNSWVAVIEALLSIKPITVSVWSADDGVIYFDGAGGFKLVVWTHLRPTEINLNDLDLIPKNRMMVEVTSWENAGEQPIDQQRFSIASGTTTVPLALAGNANMHRIVISR